MMNPAVFLRRAGVRFPLLAAGLVLAAAVSSGQQPPLDKDHAAKMTRSAQIFKEHVRTVLAEKCLRCHGGKKTEAELDIYSRESLLKGGTSGPAIVPGMPKESLLYKLVTHQKEPPMPQGGKKLPDDALKQIEEWISLGAAYDKPLLEKDDIAAWTKKIVPPPARAFWSFQPLKRLEPPAVKNEKWADTPIDRFLLVAMEKADVAPNPAVRKQQLLRRLYLDLIGLPPTPEEVAAFVKESNAKPQAALEAVVEKLLDSPRYGERWGRHWLDLARFGESHGFEHDYDRPTAYHYRDFVIQALNEDLPFDTFVKWQLAGDELTPSNPLALKATGFLAAGVHSTQITEREVAKHRYDEMDDMLSTVGTSMLGLTIGCARCHDHKFDPIPQRDYYRLLSAFTTTVRTEIELPTDADGYRKLKAKFDAEHAPLVAELKKFETEQLPARFAAWEKTNGAAAGQAGWVLPDVIESKSQGGATITPQADGSLLLTGTNPPHEVLTFVVHTDLKNITAVRLEALTHRSLVKDGPGRAGNGNFALSDFSVKIAPKKEKTAAVAVKFISAKATFEQKGLPVKAAIDNDLNSAWAIDPQFGKNHAAIFETDKPIGFEGGSVLTFTLKFNNNTQHGMGRPRLALLAGGKGELTSAAIPEGIPRALALEAAKRKPEDTARLLRWYSSMDGEWKALNQKVQDHTAQEPKPNKVKVLISSEGLPAVRLHTQGGDFLPETHFLKRGDPDQKQGVADLAYLQVLMTGAEQEKRWQAHPPQGSRTSFRRTALAEWLTDTEQGAGQLLARVIVNRLWQHHMGRGIVATPSDFGTRGTAPTNPELLDWLATELIRNGWKLKPIHKLIVTSAAFAQSSHLDPAKAAKDSDNRLFWRRPSLRLEAEVIRDSLLSVGGMLDTTMYGPGTLDEASKRRSIYFTVKRSKLIPMLQVFDAPDALGGIGERPQTTVAPQALLLMNNPHVRSYARGFAQRIAAAPTMEEAIKQGYRIALTREPTKDELTESAAFVKGEMETHKAAGAQEARVRALADFCQVLMCMNEFIYVD
jgi:cytochrome c553